MESNKISDSYNNYFDRDITSARCNKVSDISYSQHLNRKLVNLTNHTFKFSGLPENVQLIFENIPIIWEKKNYD